MKTKMINISSIIFKIIFFAFSWLYILFAVNPAITYFLQQPAFFLSKNYLYGHLAYPGGLIEYLSTFLSQFFYFPWIGALIIVLVIWLISYITGRITKSLNFNKYNLLIQLIPAAGLLFIHSNNEYILTTSMILLSSILFFYIYIQIPTRRIILKSSILIISSAVLFHISGGSALIHYIFMCLLSELFNLKKNKSVLVFILLVFAAFMPYFSARLFNYITLEQAYLFLLLPEPYYHPPVLLYGLFIYYPLLIIYISLEKEDFFSSSSIINNKIALSEKHISYISLIVQIILIAGLTILTVIFAVEPEQKFVNKVKYLAYNEEWEKLLELVKEHPTNDRFVNFHTARALYHTGRLAEDLLDYPQYWGKHALFLGEIVSRTILMDNSDVYFDLGHIRAAQHWAYEAQTIYENSPRIIKRLAMTNIILGNYKAARSILGILKNSIIYKDWAEHYQQLINDPSKLEADSLVQSKRKLQPTDIFFIDRENVNYDLSLLLKKNPNNRMAFEYLMAYHLLSNEIEDPFKNLRYLKGLGYKKIPRIYEEALMVYLTKKNIKRINLNGYTISNNTMERYRDYGRIVFKYNNDMRDAQEELYSNHGNTYWYYLHYDSPVTNKRKLKFQVKE